MECVVQGIIETKVIEFPRTIYELLLRFLLQFSFTIEVRVRRLWLFQSWKFLSRNVFAVLSYFIFPSLAVQICWLNLLYSCI